MTGRIIKNADEWQQWGAIINDTTIVDDFQIAMQYDHGAWYEPGWEKDKATDDLDYPVQVVWVPADRDLLHWPEETP